MNAAQRKTEIRVGIFVVAAIIVAGTLAFIIGGKQNVFSPKVPFTAVFTTVGGLRAGSPVTMAGVDVGTVTKVNLERDGTIHVDLGIIDDASTLVREDSLITIGSKGLLGDKLVDVVPGKGKHIPPGGVIPSESPVDLGQYMVKASKIILDTEATVANLREATTSLADPAFSQDVKDTAKNMSTLTAMVAKKDGFVDRLNQPKNTARIESALVNADKLTAELAASAPSLHAVLEEVRAGDGTANELVYGDSGKKLVRELANVSEELSIAMKTVRTGEGTAHDLIYGDRGGEILDNLALISEDLKVVSADVRAGKGTIGGLLVDPSIYEDVKRLVGNLERNEILRAFVRYSIRRGESKPDVAVEAAD